MKSRCYSYLRFSTPEQARGDSFRRQTDLAARYAARKGLALDTELTLHDLGVSGFHGVNAQTGALAQFLNMILVGAVPKGSHLLIESIDRLSRQAAWDALPTLQAIINGGVTVVTLSPEREINRDTITSNPFLLMEVLLYMIRANEESATKSRRVTEAWKSKRDRARLTNKSAGGRAPAWLQRNGEKWVVLAERAKIVKRLFRDAAKGIGQQRLAKALNAEGVATWGGGKGWDKSYVRLILRNRAVLGEYQPQRIIDGRRTPDGAPVVGYFPRVIDDAAFDAAQTSLQGKPRVPKQRVLRNLFAGLCVCGKCGASVYRALTNAHRTRYEYFTCSTSRRGESCGARAWNAAKVERLFRESSVIERAPGGGGSLEAKRTLKEVDAAIVDVRDEIENLVHAISKGRASKALTAKLGEREANLATMEQQRATLVEQIETASTVLVQQRNEAAKKLLAAKTADVEKLNAALRGVIDHIVFDFAANDLEIHWKVGGSVRCYEGSEFTPLLAAQVLPQKRDERVTVAQARAWKTGRSVKLA